MTDKELMQQALEALEYLDALQPSPDYYPEDYMQAREAITALRERLAQADFEQTYDQMMRDVHTKVTGTEQEPVAWVTGWHDGRCVIRAANPAAILPIGIALYTTPPRREWVGLTDEECWQACESVEVPLHEISDGDLLRFARAIEAKLKEKCK